MENMEKRMPLSLPRYLAAAAMAASLLALPGCAGSKSSSSSSSDYSALGDSQGPAKSAKVDDARRSAEEAEMKAHQLREEKARNPGKSSAP
jgi:hypothetical protein